MFAININGISVQFDSNVKITKISDAWEFLGRINEKLQEMPEQPQLFIEHLDDDDVKCFEEDED